MRSKLTLASNGTGPDGYPLAIVLVSRVALIETSLSRSIAVA